MLVIPAIDLMKGEVVRLYKGKKHTYKVYNSSPVEVAKQWKQCGAELVHVVDLDAAFDEGDNLDVIQEIINTGVNVQVGGGIRDLKKASRLIKMKAKRLIIGTKATDPQFLDEILSCCPPNMIAISVDILDGKVMKLGWSRETDYQFLDFVNYLVEKSLKWIIYTDISRDGTLKGINSEQIKKLEHFKDINFIASGGVRSVQDLLAVKKELPFVYGVIIGKALYEGLVDLKEALRSLV